jgi:hypothetical protein
MSENLALWQAVEKTPLEHTKPITGKSYSGNSPKPHYLIHRATETFGPCGIGWGFTVEERIEDGAWLADGFYEKLHIAKVRVWFKWNGELGEVEHIGGTVFSGRRKNGQAFSDEDAPKKSVTDALVKALSMIGFAGDIFMGRYDDSKYVAELRQEAASERQQQAPPQRTTPTVVSSGGPTEADQANAAPWITEVQACASRNDLSALFRMPEWAEAKAGMTAEAQKLVQDAVAANPHYQARAAA